MQYQTEIITIKITYNTENYKSPSTWDFENILDLEVGESVEVLEVTKEEAV